MIDKIKMGIVMDGLWLVTSDINVDYDTIMVVCDRHEKGHGMNGALGHNTTLVRLYWAGDYLGE